jgi:hypothetical protein
MPTRTCCARPFFSFCILIFLFFVFFPPLHRWFLICAAGARLREVARQRSAAVREGQLDPAAPR